MGYSRAHVVWGRGGGGQGGNEKMQCHVVGVYEYNRVHV